MTIWGAPALPRTAGAKPLSNLMPGTDSMDLYALLIEPFANYGFMRRALVACLALSLGSGPVGVFLVLRRMSLMGDAMSHAVLPGAALGFLAAGLSLGAMSAGGLLVGLAVAILAGTVSRVTALK